MRVGVRVRDMGRVRGRVCRLVRVSIAIMIMILIVVEWYDMIRRAFYYIEGEEEEMVSSSFIM